MMAVVGQHRDGMTALTELDAIETTGMGVVRKVTG